MRASDADDDPDDLLRSFFDKSGIADRSRISAIRRPLTTLERVLNTVFDAHSAGDRRKLLARFRKLQAEGLPSGRRPAKGQKSGYTELQICEITLCLMLSDFGLEPRHIVKLVERAPKISDQHPYLADFDDPDVFDHPCFAVELFYIMHMNVSSLINLREYIFVFFPEIISRSWDQPSDFSYRIGPMDEILGIIKDKPLRFAVINLTELGNRIWDALDEEQPD